jgi:hypothetical protein
MFMPGGLRVIALSSQKYVLGICSAGEQSLGLFSLDPLSNRDLMTCWHNQIKRCQKSFAALLNTHNRKARVRG